MKGFNRFNCAPPHVQSVVMCDERGRVGRLTVADTVQAPHGKPQYSFLALSDTHLNTTVGSDAEVDFIRAMRFANASEAAFTCICGDVIDGGTQPLFARYAALKGTYAAKPVRAITGNHEAHSGNDEVSQTTVERLPMYYGDPLYYTFTHGDDVFLMVGEYGWSEQPLFANGELQWLYERLEENRNRRCFVFFHVFNQDEGDSGQPTPSFYSGGDLFNHSDINKTQKQVFLSLLRHYKNTVWFHGHSHAKFELQSVNENTVCSDAHGYRSVHIPSLARPKGMENGVGVSDETASQGYVVHVYKDSIVLCGRDFAGGRFLPIATYRIDTPLSVIDAKTYTDETGIIAV